MSDTFDHEGDAWDSLEGRDYWDGDDGPRYYRSPGPSLAHCRKCGALCAWRLDTSGWRLYQDGGPHQCIARVDDFDILD